MAEYAIIKTGSKQYRIRSGDVIDVERSDATEDGNIEFANVLLFYDGKEVKIGAPTVPHVIVRGEVVDQVRGPKVVAYKYKKRKNYRRKVGHRQHYTRVKIMEFTS